MLRRDGYVKVLDFGLAKLAAGDDTSSASQALTLQAQTTEGGVVLGTFSYMSPERARGQAVDARSDVFSFGVLLHEMFAGRRPFQRETAGDELVALLREEPAPLDADGHTIPAGLARIVSKCLEKETARRYASAREMADELKSVARTNERATVAMPARGVTGVSAARGTLGDPSAARDTSVRLPRRFVFAAALVVALAACAGGYLLYRRGNVRRAERSVARVEELARDGKYFEAYDLAAQIEKYLPGDATIRRLMPDISDDLSVTTEPAGARVTLRRFTHDGSAQPQSVGTTPITHLRIARADYVHGLRQVPRAGRRLDDRSAPRARLP